MPKVSVVVPVYNVSEYLGQCLDTILLQTLQDIEIICVDDGSTDGSLDILNTYAFLDNRLKVIHQENKGLGPTRNLGMTEATGEFIIFLDSDDFFEPEMLEKMVAKAEEDGSDMVVCGFLSFDNETEVDDHEAKISEVYLAMSPLSPQERSVDLFSICSAAVWTKLFKSEFIKNNNLQFNNEYAEDIPFSYTAMALSSKISLLADCFVHYREKRPGQITFDKHKKHGANVFLPLAELYDNLKKKNLIDLFLIPYKARFLKTLSFELKSRASVEKRDFLNQFIKKISPHLSNIVFGYGNGETKLSIIIPVYNVAEFLPECLDSCLNQTLKEIEIICVDDGSTDNSLEILNEYAKRDNRITVIHQENQRQSIARENAMKIAKGEYIWYVDADDYLELDACECLYLYAKIYDLDMLSFAAIDFDNSTGFEYENAYHSLKWIPENFAAAFTWRYLSNLLPKLAVTAPLTIYRRQFLEMSNIQWIHKKIVYEDTPFFTEAILKNALMGVFTEKFYHKRVHETATTQNMNTNFSDYCWIVEYTFELVQKITQNSELLQQFIDTYLTKVYLNYQRLLPENQKKMEDSFYKLFIHTVKKYRTLLSDDLNKLCWNYLKSKSIKKKLGFLYFSLLAKWSLSGYAVRPFNLTLESGLNVYIFGIPLLKTELINNQKILFFGGYFPIYKEAVSFWGNIQIPFMAKIKYFFDLFCTKLVEFFYIPKIDLVYLWCDGNDPEFIRSKSDLLKQLGKSYDIQATASGRFIQVDELKYSLRSVAKYMPWIHHIFIVTNHQKPEWLNLKHPKLTIVDHSEILPKEALPTFNASAIETALYKIPKLSNLFLFANDDTFVNRPVKPSFFFTILGKIIFRFQIRKLFFKSLYDNQLMYAIKTIDARFHKYFYMEPHHNIDAYLKKDFKNCVHEFKKEFDKATCHHFREERSISRLVVGLYSVLKNHAYLKLVNNKYYSCENSELSNDSLIISNSDNLEQIIQANPVLFCINDTEFSVQKNREKAKAFLEKRFPDKCEFEV